MIFEGKQRCDICGEREASIVTGAGREAIEWCAECRESSRKPLLEARKHVPGVSNSEDSEELGEIIKAAMKARNREVA